MIVSFPFLAAHFAELGWDKARKALISGQNDLTISFKLHTGTRDDAFRDEVTRLLEERLQRRRGKRTYRFYVWVRVSTQDPRKLHIWICRGEKALNHVQQVYADDCENLQQAG